jgi:hypothetical protein
MPRPTTKEGLLDAAGAHFAKMWQLVDSLPAEAQEATFDFADAPSRKEAHWQRDKNLRDVFVHLYEWHQLLLTWVGANMSASLQEPQAFLPAPYTWKTYGQMNVEFWQKHQSTTLSEAKATLLESHQNVIALVEQFSDLELFEKKYFGWTGTTNLASYSISATSSHYDWAIKKIKEHVKGA